MTMNAFKYIRFIGISNWKYIKLKLNLFNKNFVLKVIAFKMYLFSIIYKIKKYKFNFFF